MRNANSNEMCTREEKDRRNAREEDVSADPSGSQTTNTR